jgi:N-methylhydantoinase A/oxoprolinase/acetone carboxylase beta subunit
MAKNARKILTFGSPDAFVVFGSAGGQHCCDIASKIGINHVIIHRYSGILSAYGLSKANQSKCIKIYLGL